MTRQKSPVTVRRAVEQVFDEQPEYFYAPFFCMVVKVRCNRQMLMDGTILRRLREARADSPAYQYRCVDTTLALYKKVKNPTA